MSVRRPMKLEPKQKFTKMFFVSFMVIVTIINLVDHGFTWRTWLSAIALACFSVDLYLAIKKSKEPEPCT